MSRETGVLLKPWLDLLPTRKDNDVRNAISLEEIFKGQEYLLRNLTPEQEHYLHFVVAYRLVKARGDEAEAKYLLQLLNKKEAERMANQLGEQRKIIFEATPLPIEELSLADPNNPTEIEEMRDHLQDYPQGAPPNILSAWYV